MGLQLTGLGVLIALLWLMADSWEWPVSKSIENKISVWKGKFAGSQIIVKFTNPETIYNQEQFALSLKPFLRHLEAEMGIPVRCESELSGDEGRFSEEELIYIKCLNQAFSGITWHIQETIPQQRLGDQVSS